jgi:hypothetical protein
VEGLDQSEVVSPQEIVAAHDGRDEEPPRAGAVIRLDEDRGSEIQVAVVFAENDLARGAFGHGKETDPIASIARTRFADFGRCLHPEGPHELVSKPQQNLNP